MKNDTHKGFLPKWNYPGVKPCIWAKETLLYLLYSVSSQQRNMKVILWDIDYCYNQYKTPSWII